MDYRAGHRRYCPSNNAKKVLLEFVEQVKRVWLEEGQKLYDRQPSDPQLDIPMRRCFQEVGWGADVFSRAAQHPNHVATNYVIGLFHATVTRFYPGVFEMRQYQVLRVVRPEFASLSEYLISQIASSYWYEGGLNAELAGRCPYKGHHQQFYAENTRAVSESSLYKDNVKYQKEMVSKTNDMLKWFETFDPKAFREEHEKKLWSLVASWRDISVQTDELIYRWALEWLNELWAAYEAEQRSA